MADEGPTVEIQNDAWFAAGRRIGEQAREIAELRAENERLRAALLEARSIFMNMRPVGSQQIDQINAGIAACQT